MRSLETTTFLNLFDNISSEKSKLEIFEELLKRLSLSSFISRECILAKMKLEASVYFTDEKVRTLFMNSNDKDLISDCYIGPAYAKELNKKVSKEIKKWKFISIAKDGFYVFETEDDIPDAERNSILTSGYVPFSFEMINKINSDILCRAEFHYGIIKWYDI